MGMLDSLFGGGGGSAPPPEFVPYGTETSMGSVNIGPDNIVRTSLDPRYRAIANQLIGAFGGASPSYSPETLALGQQATRTGAGFLDSLGSFDPFAAAEEQFNRMEAVLEKSRGRDRTALQEKLLRQGRLGSSGGGIEQEGLESAIEQSRRANLVDAFGQAQNVQRQKAELANTFGAFGAGVEDTQLQRLLNSLGQGIAVESLPLAFGDLGYKYTGARSSHDTNAYASQQQDSGGSMFGSLLGGIVGSAAGPIGKAAGQYVGGKLF
jgi:hypothetical protein